MNSGCCPVKTKTFEVLSTYDLEAFPDSVEIIPQNPVAARFSPKSCKMRRFTHYYSAHMNHSSIVAHVLV